MAENKPETKATRTPPAGMKQVDTDIDQYPKWDFDKDELLEGTVTKVKNVTVQRNGEDEETKMAVVEVNGEKRILWMSSNLEEFFEAIGPGSEIWVLFKGMEPLGKGKTMRSFDAFTS